jgi:hypothetical protein
MTAVNIRIQWPDAALHKKCSLRLNKYAIRDPAQVIVLPWFTKSLRNLVVESGRTSMLPYDLEEIDSSRKGDAWSKK